MRILVERWIFGLRFGFNGELERSHQCGVPARRSRFDVAKLNMWSILPHSHPELQSARFVLLEKNSDCNKNWPKPRSISSSQSKSPPLAGFGWQLGRMVRRMLRSTRFAAVVQLRTFEGRTVFLTNPLPVPA